MLDLAIHARARLLSREDALLHSEREADRRELLEVLQALERIRQGRYGRCEQCGGAIGKQRLTAIPEARFCLGCDDRSLAR